MKNFIIYFLMIVFAAFFLIWERNYEKNTLAINNRIDKIETKLDTVYEYAKFNDYRITYPQEDEYLIVPEKPIDYWKDEDFKIKSETFYKGNINVIVDYIKEKEGFHSKAYRDGCLIKAKKCPPSKYRYSIGYGTLAKSKNEKITKQEAEKRLIIHIKQTIWPKMKNVKFESLAQYYASVDFAYNVGHNAFANNIVQDDGYVDCAKMTEYVYFNGKENKGLKSRRFENFLQCVTYEEDNL